MYLNTLCFSYSGRSRSGSSASFSGIAATGMHHSYSQPILGHRRSSSASFTLPRSVDTLTHSASTSRIEYVGAQVQSARLSGVIRHRSSQESVATTDYDDDEITQDSEKDYSTPSSGSGSRKSEHSDLGIEIRHRNVAQDF